MGNEPKSEVHRMGEGAGEAGSNNGGWVKSFRKVKEWGWYRTPFMYHLFSHLIRSANHKPGVWMGQTIERGQLVTGRKALSAETGISERSIRTCIKRLISTKEVTIKTTSKYSIITICNYEQYQARNNTSDQEIDQEIDQQVTSKRPASDHKQEEQELKNNKNDINMPSLPILKPQFNPEGKMKFLDWVYMDDAQWKRIKTYYDEKGLSFEDLKEAIRELDRWFGDNPKMRAKRTDDAKALMGWPLDNALKRKRELIYTKKAEEQ